MKVDPVMRARPSVLSGSLPVWLSVLERATAGSIAGGVTGLSLSGCLARVSWCSGFSIHSSSILIVFFLVFFRLLIGLFFRLNFIC